MTVIEVFADIGCPFTHVGLKRLIRHRTQAGRTDVALHVRAWPLEIVNGRPLDPVFVADEVADIRRQVAPGLFAGFTAEAMPASTLPALHLAAAAYREGLEVGEAVSLRLRDLLFEEGRDVSDPAVLRTMAGDFDLQVTEADAAQVLADHAEGVRRGVIGSPHFFTPAGDFFCPSLDISRRSDGHLRIDADSVGFAQLVDACLA